MWAVSETMKNETADKENLLYFFKIEELVDLQRRLCAHMRPLSAA